MIDVVVILFAFIISVIAGGIAIYALLTVIDLEKEIEKLKKIRVVSSPMPKVERRIKSPWN